MIFLYFWDMEENAIVFGSLIIAFIEEVPIEIRLILAFLGIIIALIKIIKEIYNFRQWIKTRKNKN